MYGPLHFRALEADKKTALLRTRGNFDKRMTLSSEGRTDLNWWVANVGDSLNVLTRENPVATLTTDACNDGWGAVFDSKSTGGVWSHDEKQNHINYLKLLAVFLGLKTFLRDMSDMHVRLMIDNSTAVAVLNHMGTSHSPKLNTLCKIIWEWAIKSRLWLTAAHIAGKLNVEADLASRTNDHETEWMLNRSSLLDALKKLNRTPDVDIFASRLNKQFPVYVSFKPDPGATAVDAFSLSWSDKNVYAFPPFSVIPAMLKKLQEDKATGVCVLPDWPTQAWYPKALAMATLPTVHLKPHRSLLTLPNQPGTVHPLHKKMGLIICLLSGAA